MLCVAWSPHLSIDSQSFGLVSQSPFETHSCLVISWIILIETQWVWSWWQWHSGHCPYRAPLTWSVSLDPEKLPESAQLQTWPSLSFLCTDGGTHGWISHPSTTLIGIRVIPASSTERFKIVQHLRNYSMRDWIWIFPPTGASHLLGRGARAWQWPPVSRVLGTACSGACSLQSAPHCRLCRTQSASLTARTILCIPSSVTQPKFQRNLLYRSLMRWAWREERCQREASGLGVSTLIL